jgi:dienelactone hydrolase
VLLAVCSACATAPRVAEYRNADVSTLTAADPGRSPILDGRARFREVFCGLARGSGAATASDPDCADLLWRSADEPAIAAPATGAPASARASPSAAGPLRFVLVTGAFDDCYGDEGLPFREAARALSAKGYDVQTVRLSGRSSAVADAEALDRAILPMLRVEGRRLVLIGYSKGAVDILEMLGTHPEVAPRIAAVVSVAGPVHGTPLATVARPLYDGLLAHAMAGRCSPGDGGVIDSLVPEVRRRWFETHALPSEVRFYSLVALPRWDVMARALKASWRVLAGSSRLNDGQIRAQDALIPGSTLLGFVDADHWGIALRIERVLPHIAARADRRPFPQLELLETIFLTVSADVARAGAPDVPP